MDEKIKALLVGVNLNDDPDFENALKELLPELIALGYDARVYSDNRELDSYFGGVQGIRVEEEGYHGGADPRRDGKALGY